MQSEVIITDIALEMDNLEGVDLSSVCYIGKKFLGIPIPFKDFVQRGNAWVSSSQIKKLAYILRKIQDIEPILESSSDFNSPYRKLGRIMKEYEPEDIYLMALYGVYGHKHYKGKERKRAQSLVQGLVEKWEKQDLTQQNE